jgi:hypothetical protein
VVVLHVHLASIELPEIITNLVMSELTLARGTADGLVPITVGYNCCDGSDASSFGARMDKTVAPLIAYVTIALGKLSDFLPARTSRSSSSSSTRTPTTTRALSGVLECGTALSLPVLMRMRYVVFQILF